MITNNSKEKDILSEEIIKKLKNASNKEKEFIIFKLFFKEKDYISKEQLLKVLPKNPFLIDRLLKIIDEADDAQRRSQKAIYNREKCCLEVIKEYKLLLEKMSKLAKELHINSSLELSILFSYLLWKGYLSKTKKQEYEEYNGPLLLGLNFTDISNGIGVCRNYSEMLKDFLDFNGYNSVMLANYLDDNTKVDYTMNIAERKIYSVPNGEIFVRKKANHAFNLIEDNGLYIYDPTNLLFYNLKNNNTATLINGRGKNTIYPYRSYDFCYSKKDEQLLDRMINGDDFTPVHDKTDLISTSEVNLELITNNTSLIEDFYIESKPDIVGISEETEKILKRIK